MKKLIKNKEFRAIFYLICFILFLGTVVYNWFEGWGWFNSFYFSVITLATIGYGDMTPSTFGSKAFTVFYIFIGIGILVTFIGLIAKQAIGVWGERILKNEADVRGFIGNKKREVNDGNS